MSAESRAAKRDFWNSPGMRKLGFAVDYFTHASAYLAILILGSINFH